MICRQPSSALLCLLVIRIADSPTFTNSRTEEKKIKFSEQREKDFEKTRAERNRAGQFESNHSDSTSIACLIRLSLSLCLLFPNQMLLNQSLSFPPSLLGFLIIPPPSALSSEILPLTINSLLFSAKFGYFSHPIACYVFLQPAAVLPISNVQRFEEFRGLVSHSEMEGWAEMQFDTHIHSEPFCDRLRQKSDPEEAESKDKRIVFGFISVFSFPPDFIDFYPFALI